MFYLPVGLRVNDKRVVIIGGGLVAFRKAQLMKRESALEIRIIANRFEKRLTQWAATQKAVYLVEKAFEAGDLNEADIVIAATDDRVLNKRIGYLAREMGKLVNVADTKFESDFVTMALIEREDLIVSVFSDARNPAKTVQMKKKLEEML